MQASFKKKDEFLLWYLSKEHLLEDKLNIRGQRLYKILLQIYIENEWYEFPLDYRYLEKKLKYSARNIRRAFQELEAQKLAFRKMIKGTRKIYVQVNTKIFIND